MEGGYPRPRPFHVARPGHPRIMSPNREIADTLEMVMDGVWSWQGVRDPASSSHAIRVELEDGRIGVVLVDPVRLDGHAMQQLPHVIVAVVITAAAHQRDAWRIRRLHAAPVWAPAGAEQLDEEPDVRYAAGDQLPAQLVAVEVPGSDGGRLLLRHPKLEAVLPVG